MFMVTPRLFRCPLPAGIFAGYCAPALLDLRPSDRIPGPIFPAVANIEATRKKIASAKNFLRSCAYANGFFTIVISDHQKLIAPNVKTRCIRHQWGMGNA
jgi:hypothetical protein